MKAKNFRDLKVWQQGQKLVLEIYRVTSEFPDTERYGLTSQMKRAAVSIPSNIAEGFNRYHNREYRHFFYISLGSCAELETQMEIAINLGFLNSQNHAFLLDIIDHEYRMLRRLIEVVSVNNEIRDTNDEIRSHEY